MSIHTMPTRTSNTIEKIVAIPVTAKSERYPTGKKMFIAHVYSSLFSAPIYTTKPVFMASSAVGIAERWMTEQGYEWDKDHLFYG